MAGEHHRSNNLCAPSRSRAKVVVASVVFARCGTVKIARGNNTTHPLQIKEFPRGGIRGKVGEESTLRWFLTAPLCSLGRPGPTRPLPRSLPLALPGPADPPGLAPRLSPFAALCCGLLSAWFSRFFPNPSGVSRI